MHVNVEEILRRQDKVADVFRNAHQRIVGEQVFWYKWGPSLEFPNASAWLLVFFDAFPILGVIHPPQPAAAVAV
jgi:hypothetical protein